MKICIAGKNDIACNVLRDILAAGFDDDELCVICNRSDTGKNTWQESLRFVAQQNGIQELGLKEVQEVKDLLFLSVEFDRIIRPERFRTDLLYNIHFSALPRHRGVSTAIWPLLDNDTEAGVTFHEIDPGIDTGKIVAQTLFPIHDNDTARDLYFKFMDEGRKLVVEQAKLIHRAFPERVRAVPQDETKATYHSRDNLDFRNLKIRDYSVLEVTNFLRAFSFFEYQLPVVKGEKVIDFDVIQTVSTQAPGTLIKKELHEGLLSTTEFDVRLIFDPHQYLYAWARFEKALPEGFDFSQVTEIDRLDANGWSALMVAAYFGNLEALVILLAHGANPNLANKRGTTVLMYARSGAIKTGESTSFAHLLAAHADPSVEDANGKTVSWYLEANAQTELLNMLRG